LSSTLLNRRKHRRKLALVKIDLQEIGAVLPWPTMTTGTFKIPTRIRRGYTLMLRTCTGEDDGRLTAHGGFFWPALGPVECPDWKPVAECGNGLHGFLRGCGNHNLANWTDRAVWLVVEVKTSEIVSLEGKIKVPRGRVIYSGERLQALETMARLGHLDNGHMGGTATAGDRGTLQIKWWDRNRYCISTAYVDEDGITAGTKYQLDGVGKFIVAEISK